MSGTELGTVGTWAEAFKLARELLVKDQLTAIAVVPEREYAGGAYVVTHLKEFEARFGCVDKVLDYQEEASKVLYRNATKLRLIHRASRYPRPEGMVDGWILTIVHND